ncbi:MAG: HAD-IC family P-type ATPase [Terrimicrobiaceae bacterium]
MLPVNAIHFSPILAELARLEKIEVCTRMKTSPEGLSEADAEKRLAEAGPNVIASEKHRGWLWRLLTATRNPLVILLIVLAMISFATGDAHAGTVMSLMVILGVSLRFAQEARADAAAAKLKAMITLTTAVVRAGKAEEIPLQELAPGDVVTLCAGDMIPADVRIISAKDLFVSQATLTGESLPVEKFDSRETRDEVSPLEFSNICFLGTSVESGAATAVVVATGAQTYFGSMASSIVGEQVETSFDKGMQQFTWLMIRFMMVMVPLVFFINGFTKHNWHEAFFFSVAVAVGLTPEMLPMIVSVCLSKGALAMSKNKVIVKHLDTQPLITKEDERDLILKGYVAFLDPPKVSTAKAIEALQKHGVTVKVLTGDNDLVTRKVCREVGLKADDILLGGKVETMTDDELTDALETTHIFARLSPAHKQRIIRALQHKQHVVGFMGDGINDAPALHVADVGISVDSAVDIAKAAAAVILLEKDLMVLQAGVIEGRKVFVNILKYVRMGASSNFGNMFSVIGASAFLPFVPMAPIQVLTNNLLYDFSQVPIPTDTVGPEETAKPRPWHIGDIKKFVLSIGPISSIFDYTTFFVMLYVFGCWDPARASLFQTGWFVESLITQTLIIHVIRTKKLPFIQGRASWQLTVTTVIVMGIAMWLPFSPVAAALGFTQLPLLYWPILFLTVLCYVVLTQVVKMWLIRKAWI